MKKRDSDYDTAVQKHLRGEIPSSEVWKADPYDPALRRMAQRAYERESRSNTKGPKDVQKAHLD